MVVPVVAFAILLRARDRRCASAGVAVGVDVAVDSFPQNKPFGSSWDF